MNQVKKQPRKFSVLTPVNERSRNKFLLPLDAFSNKYIQKFVVMTSSSMTSDAVYDYESVYSSGTNSESRYANMFRLAKMNSGRIIVPQLYSTHSGGSRIRLKLNDTEIHISSSLFDLLVNEFGMKYYIDENREHNGYKIKVIVISDDMIAPDLTESLVEVGRLVKVTDDSQIWGTDTLLGYHYSAWHPKIASNFTKYMDKTLGAVNFGFEAEKQDYTFRDRENAIKLAFETGFKKERDGSLGDGGFELISPVLPLNNDAVINEVLAPVRDILDAETSDRCGGHINVSINGVQSKDILKKVKGSLPIFYSIYEKRLNNSYCQAQQFGTYLRSPRKYQSFYVKNNEILEFRIFPAIKSNTILKNRIDLMRIVLNDLYGKTHNKVILEMAKKNSKLYNFMLNVVCNGDMDKFKNKFKTFITLSAKYKCGIVTFNTIKKVEQMMSMSIITPTETTQEPTETTQAPRERVFHVDLPDTTSTWVTDAVTELSNDDSYRQERSNDVRDGSIDGVNEDVIVTSFAQNVESYRGLSSRTRTELNTAFLSDEIYVNNIRATNEQLCQFFAPNSMVSLGTPCEYSSNFSIMVKKALNTIGGVISSVLNYETLPVSVINSQTERLFDSCRDNDMQVCQTYSQSEMSFFNRIFAMLITTSRFTDTTNMCFRAEFKLSTLSSERYYMNFIRHEDGTYICALAKRLDGNRFVYIFNEHELSLNLLTDSSQNPF